MARRLFFMPFFLLLVVLIHKPTLAKDKSYTMICQGGGKMTASFERKIRFDKPDLYITTVRFGKAGAAAGKQGPGPGQCAWLDRPVSSAEPSTLIFKRTGKNPIWQLNLSHNNMSLISADKEEFALLKAVHKGEQVIIKAKRDGDSFRVTGIGP